MNDKGACYESEWECPVGVISDRDLKKAITRSLIRTQDTVAIPYTQAKCMHSMHSTRSMHSTHSTRSLHSTRSPHSMNRTYSTTVYWFATHEVGVVPCIWLPCAYKRQLGAAAFGSFGYLPLYTAFHIMLQEAPVFTRKVEPWCRTAGHLCSWFKPYEVSRVPPERKCHLVEAEQVADRYTAGGE
jgi:hypothetical protein